MTDVAYQCHNCGSVHEVESIRENLILDLRAAASYGHSGQRGMPDPRARFPRWRMTGAWCRPSGPGIRIIHIWPRPVGWCSGRPRPYLIALSPAGRQLVAPMRAQVTGL